MIKTKEEFREAWFNDLLEEIDDDIDDSWRHGNNHKTVFELYDSKTENTTGTFWKAIYRVSGDGEYHGIRENDFEFARVYPHEVIVRKTVYKLTP